MEIVNGYPCYNCTDTDLAKKGIDPARPEDDPRSPKYNPTTAQADGANSRDTSVTFGGALAALGSAQSSGSGESDFTGSRQQPRLGASLDIRV